MNRNFGVIDLGSNTARLVVYEQDEQGLVTEVDNIKRGLRLSNHLQNGRMDDEGVAKTIHGMRQFKELLDARNINDINDIIAVATAAVRQAENGHELTQRINQETGIAVRVLSGEDEARYGYLAVINSMRIEEGITIDIGGGSTEVTYFRNSQLQESFSFPFGIVTLTQMFFQGDIPTETEFYQLRSFLSRSFSSCPWLMNKQCPVIAIGGTARNLAKIHQRSVQYSMDSFHHYTMTGGQLTTILEQLSQLPLEARRQVPGISKDRADVILAGLTVFDTLLNYADSTELIVSSKGLRDGILFETVWGTEAPTSIREIHERSITQFMNRYQIDKAHAYQVKEHALSLFDQLKAHDLHKYGSFERDLLEASALLHDVGRTINVHESSEHTFYLLSHVLLAGYTHRERLLIAMIASFKSNKLLQSQLTKHADIVCKTDKNLVERLGHLLLLARMLDRSLSQAIHSIQLVKRNGHWVIECQGKRECLLEYSLLDEPLTKLSKAWKLPITFLPVTDADKS
ncbi:Ppx/GppA phosphatase family protein [Brevibacillus choshinensis]|uniref:Ppx/GppA phosphatase family protein n=1 Tax=Brevibacillus choshinensis TaxID=54911 RepID=UPI002E251F41|nr:Ppx/GppA phosphatase family protein [Brevibacillus choshinensis]